MPASEAPTTRPAAQLRGSDTQSPDDFGAAVAVSGSTAVVGAPGHGGGRAYVFTAAAAGWTQTAEVQGSDTAAGDSFGTAVAISGSTAVAGAPGRGGGRAYAFTRTATGWTQTAELKDSDTAQNDEFGTALARRAPPWSCPHRAVPNRPGGSTRSSTPLGGGSRRPN